MGNTQQKRQASQISLERKNKDEANDKKRTAADHMGNCSYHGSRCRVLRHN